VFKTGNEQVEHVQQNILNSSSTVTALMLRTAHLMATCRVGGTGSQSCHFSGSEPVRCICSLISRSVWRSVSHSVSYFDR